MKKLIDSDETVLYNLTKRRTPILSMIIFIPVWLYMGGILLIYSSRYFLKSASDIQPEMALIAGLAAALVVFPMVLCIFLSYARNTLVITDRKVYVRRGLTARTQIVNLTDVRAFQHAYSSGRRGKRNHKIYFYLFCGQYIKTGDLFITYGSLEDLLALLREKFEGRGFTPAERKQLGRDHPQAELPVTKTNFFVLALLLAPFVLALLLAAAYFARR